MGSTGFYVQTWKGCPGTLGKIKMIKIVLLSLLIFNYIGSQSYNGFTRYIWGIQLESTVVPDYIVMELCPAATVLEVGKFVPIPPFPETPWSFERTCDLELCGVKIAYDFSEPGLFMYLKLVPEGWADGTTTVAVRHGDTVAYTTIPGPGLDDFNCTLTNRVYLPIIGS